MVDASPGAASATGGRRVGRRRPARLAALLRQIDSSSRATRGRCIWRLPSARRSSRSSDRREPARYATARRSRPRRPRRPSLQPLQPHPATARRAASATRRTASSTSRERRVRRRSRCSTVRRARAAARRARMTDAASCVGRRHQPRQSFYSRYLDARPKNGHRRRHCVDQESAARARRRAVAAWTLHVSRRFAVVVRGALPAQAAGYPEHRPDDRRARSADRT